MASGISDRVQALQIVPGRQELAFITATPEGRALHLIAPEDGRVIRGIPLLLPGERATTLIDNFRFSPDGGRVAAANADGRSVDIVDVATGRRLYTLPNESGVVWWLAWPPPDGRASRSRAKMETCRCGT